MLSCKWKWPNIVFPNRLTLEQKELCRCRLRLLTYLDRLATYEVRGSFNQDAPVHLTCHRNCHGFPRVCCPWSLELFMWEKFLLDWSRCLRLPVLVENQSSRGTRGCFVSPGTRNAASASARLCVPHSLTFSLTSILLFGVKVTTYSFFLVPNLSTYWVLITLIWIFLIHFVLMIC